MVFAVIVSTVFTVTVILQAVEAFALAKFHLANAFAVLSSTHVSFTLVAHVDFVGVPRSVAGLAHKSILTIAVIWV